MDIYRSILSICDNNPLFERHANLVNECAVNLKLLQDEDDRLLKVHVKEINSLLNNPKTRDRGLRQLVDLVPECSHQVLSEQCARWFKFSHDAIKSAGRKSERMSLACVVVTSLLSNLHTLPELQRFVNAKSSSSIVLDLATHHNHHLRHHQSILECLYEYLRAAPGPCLQHRKSLEEHMLKHLDDAIGPAGRRDAVTQAGRVFAVLPIPGAGGGNVAQAKADARGRQLTQLLSVAHSLMDYLMDGVIEKESHPHPKEHTSLPLRPLQEITQDPIASHLLSVTRLINTLKFTSELISDRGNQSITITPNELLGVPFRLLQMESAVLSRYKSQEHKIFAFFLPSLHQHALLLLRDAINSLGEGIDCYMGTLLNLLTSVLESSRSSRGKGVPAVDGHQTALLAYHVIAELIRVSQGRHSPPSALVTLLLRDATPTEDMVKLKKHGKGLASVSVSKASGSGGGGKKKGYTVSTTTNTTTTSTPQHTPHQYSRLARVALVVAEMLFTHATHSLSPRDHQRLQEGVVSISEVVAGSSNSPDMYSDPKTRVQLYTTLSSLTASPHPLYPPPYNYIMNILIAGLSDTDLQVVSVCKSFMCTLSVIVANPRIEETSRLAQQLKQNIGNTAIEVEEEEEEQEVSNLNPEEEEEEEEDSNRNQEEEEERLSDKAEEEEEEEEDDDDEEEEEKEEEVTESKEEETEQNSNNNNNGEEKIKDTKENGREEKMDKEEEEIIRSTRRKTQEVKIKRMEERGKRNGGKEDQPVKKKRKSSVQEKTEEVNRELSVEEMLLDFVGE